MDKETIRMAAATLGALLMGGGGGAWFNNERAEHLSTANQALADACAETILAKEQHIEDYRIGAEMAAADCKEDMERLREARDTCQIELMQCAIAASDCF